MLLNKDIDIIQFMFNNFEKSYTATQIANILKINQKTTSNHMKALEKILILKSTTQGKNKLFTINKDNLSLTKDFIIAILALYKINFLNKKLILKEILDKIEVDKMIVFGSYAKDKEKKTSDIDICIIGKYNKELIQDLSNLYNIEINIKSFTQNNFKKALKNKDILINEIVKTGVIISGYKYFINNYIKYYYETQMQRTN